MLGNGVLHTMALQPPGCCHFGLAVSPNWCGSPDSSVGKEPVCNAGDPGSIPGLG